MTAIRVQNLSKIYRLYDSPKDRLKEAIHPLKKKYHRDFYALRDISFKVRKGETVGIIGKNGSGKSTLLTVIAGLLTPTSGTVGVEGKVSALLELGAGFNLEYTGIENIYLNGMLMGFSRSEMERKLGEIIDFADIGDFIHQPVRMYSSGMTVRLAFAVAINVDPDILIVDEALAVGDIRFQQKCYRRIKEFHEKNRTILFCTHDTGAVLNLCSKCIWIDTGRVREYGEPEEMIKKYQAYMYYDLDVQEPEADGEGNHDETKGETTDEAAVTGAATGKAAGETTDATAKIAGETPAAATDAATDETAAAGGRFPAIPKIPWLEVSGCSFFGEGGAGITHLCFYEERSGRPVNILKGGERVVLGIRTTGMATLDNPIFGFNFKNAYGVSAFGTNTLQEGYRAEELSKNEIMETYFTFIFPPLANGNYSLDVAIADGTQAVHVQHCWKYDVLAIKVENTGDKYGFGYIYVNPGKVSIKKKNKHGKA